MARRTLTLTIKDKGRDKGKKFLLTELSASDAEKWAMRAFTALAKSGVTIPDDIAGSGLIGIAMMGMKALGGLAFEDLEPLLDTMMSCVQFVPEGHDNLARSLFSEDIEELKSRLTIRTEVFKLHTEGFFDAAS